MILDRELVRRIVRGQKREHRFPVVIVQGKNFPHSPGFVKGSQYPVHYVLEGGKRSEPLYVEVKSVYRMDVADMDDAAAVRTGFDSLEDFKETWPRSWRGQMWVVEFEVAKERPKFLTALAGHAPSSDYTSSAARALDPDAEVVDQATLKKYAEENRKTFRQDLEAERDRLAKSDLGVQLAEVRAEAKDKRVDISGNLRLIEKQLRSIKRKLDAHKAA